MQNKLDVNKPLSKRKRTRLTPEKRRAQLLECAINACADKGLARAAHADVAARAGVSVATVFSYFNTREILVDCVLEEVKNILFSSMEKVTNTESSAPDQIFEMVWYCAVLVRQQPDVMLVWLDWSTAVRNPIWPQYLEFQKNIIALFTKIIRKGKRQNSIDKRVDAMSAARIIIGESHMLAMLVFEGVSDKQTRKFIRQYVHMSCSFQALES